MPSQMHPLQVLLTDDLRNDLSDLSSRLNASRGFIVRQLIKHAADMLFRNRPRCVSGKDCIVPHLHPPPEPPREHPAQSTLHM